ncbi:MAG: MarR family transcriptional regulator [Clostridiales bacterium]|nr:MarR family transcriptional regulator [Clostridiales bacterium]
MEDLEKLIGCLLARLDRGRRRYLANALEGTGLRGPMHRYLLLLSTNPGASQEFLAESLQMEKGNNARFAKELEDLGFIKREPDLSNRRQYKIYLTEKGNSLLPQIQSALSDWNKAASKGLSLQEQEALAGLLRRMAENVV